MPRKTQSRTVATWPQEGASMRPGQKCPGKRPKVTSRSSRESCFNEAGAEMPRKTDIRWKNQDAPE